MKVFLIGRRAAPTRLSRVSDLDIEAVAAQVRGPPPSVARCDGLDDVLQAVRGAAAREPIDRLDLLDHGAEGIQSMGDAILFESDASPASPLGGRDLARQLAPYLSETAQVRLLGCNTAEGPRGRLLLLKLARLLGGHRTVFGMIDRVVEADFDAEGYAPVMEHQRLFSSDAALEGEAPSAMQRFEHMRPLGPRWCDRRRIDDAAHADDQVEVARVSQVPPQQVRPGLGIPVRAQDSLQALVLQLLGRRA